MSAPLELPAVVAGRLVERPATEATTIRYESGHEVRLTPFTETDLDAVLASLPDLRRELDQLTIRDIGELLARVGREWLRDGSPWRRWALRRTADLTGYHPEMIASDHLLFGEWLSSPASIYDQVSSELGDEHVFDEWIPQQASYIRAYGRGLAIHVLVGNLPLASLYSLVRGIISRNVNLAKLPSRDPISVHALVRTMLEVAPDHPITRATSLGFWSRDADVGTRALRAADVAVVWGGTDAIESIGAATGGATPIVAFGPKRSLAVVDLTAPDADVGTAAKRLAFEATYYDQEACFSPQRVLVVGPLEPFLDALVSALTRLSDRMPLVTPSSDVLAHRTMSVMASRFLAHEVRRAGDAHVVVTPHWDDVDEHPLTRTLYVHPIASPSDAAAHIDRDTQTIAVHPWSTGHANRDAWAAAGADRIVDLGMSRHPRQGFSHDGMRWLQQMVRFVSVERPITQLYRYNSDTPEQLATWLFDLPHGLELDTEPLPATWDGDPRG
jgi:long-chain-fatty-acyl-CoA reductase